MSPPSAVVRHISTSTIKPATSIPDSFEAKQPCHLSPWDYALLSYHYNQKGLFFSLPSSSQPQVIYHLKHSLSLTLVHFYPLAARLATTKNDDDNSLSYFIFIDCNNDAGAKFVHAVAEHVRIADVLSPDEEVNPIVKAFFDLNGAVNHDGHTLPLLVVQVTQLVDGIFVGCSFNHVVGDGTSFWHFFNTWSEISRKLGEGKDIEPISRPTVFKRWFPEGYGPVINLPFSGPEEFITRFAPPLLKERIFSFSAQSIARLKARANKDCNTNVISSFQALCALVWRSVTRARGLNLDRKTKCKLAINNRSRLNPPLSQDHVGNYASLKNIVTTVRNLLDHDLGSTALLLHQAIANHTDEVVNQEFMASVNAPVAQLGRMVDESCVMFTSSPRFDMYGNDFGWGKPLAVRSGYASKFDGRVTSYPGKEGGGSIDLEICLSPETMKMIEKDEEFMDSVSPSERRVVHS